MGVLHPPAMCRKCGLIHAATGYAMEENFGTTFAGCQTVCPICGSTSDVLDGVYNFHSNTVELTAGPPSTIAIFKELAKVVTASVAAGESREKTFERAAQIDPRFNKFKRVAVEAVIALGILIEWAGNANTVYDWYDALRGGKARQEYSQQLKASEDGARLALEKFHASQEYKTLQERMKLESVEPPPPLEASRPGLRPNIHPVLVQYPGTVRKLADYQKNRGKNH